MRFSAWLALLGALLLSGGRADQEKAARLNSLGAAYMNQQSFEKALSNFEEAAQIDPGIKAAEINQGIALLNIGKVDAAKPILEEAVRLNPKDPNAWYNLGLLYKNTSEPGRAVDAFRQVIAIDSDDADTWYFLGSVYSQQKKFPEAIDAFEHALKLNTLHASAQFGLARAYQQSGDAARAKEGLQRFQYITQNKLGSPISLAYGEQGKYSRVEEVSESSAKVPAEIDVRFTDVTSQSGLTARLAATGDDLGPGACIFDLDNDGRPDVFLAANGPKGGMALFRNVGGSRFEDITSTAGLDPTAAAVSCTAGDYDNDGATDLVVAFRDHIALLHNEKNSSFKDVSTSSGLAKVSSAQAHNAGVTFVDYDHDGDLDLLVSRESASKSPAETSTSAMYRNNGDGTFTEVTRQIGLPQDPAIAAIGSDFNNDRAVDLIQTGSQQHYRVMENPREGPFAAKEFGASSSETRAVVALDYDHDGWMDLAFSHADGQISLLRNDNGKGLSAVPLPPVHWKSAWGLAAFDYDNDGWVDLAAVGENEAGKAEIRLFRNLGPQGWQDVTAHAGLDKLELNSPRCILAVDFEGDGQTGLLITQNRGPAVLLKNQGSNKNHWLRVALKGLNDNKSAIGTKVEVFSGANRQKFEIAGSSGYLGQNASDLIVGLGSANEADIVRLLWPTGVLQDEVELAADREQKFTEIDRRGSSCPTLFVWNGESYELVGDILGAGVVGHWVGPNQKNIPRPVEYLKVDRHMIREKDGKLSFRLMEPMEEVVYLDSVSLVAVDHPAAYDVDPDEKFLDGPPYPQFKVVSSKGARLPAGAWDDRGRDILPDLAAHRYVGGFDLLPFKGFARMHSIDLDLGEKYEGGPLRLLLHGEIEYFTATGMYAADQAGVHGVSPFVEAQDASGRWVKVVDDMGFPAGLPRTMTADLTGKLPRGTQRIRITTNLQIYWDNILVDRSAPATDYRLGEMQPASAQLAFHGYPKQIEDLPPGNVKYLYGSVSRTGPYARQSGNYTRFGDVKDLLSNTDDRSAVFGSGEEVQLEFDTRGLKPLPKGWVRDYFLKAHGYEKDMDFYAAEGATVDPLPFAAMETYPYPGKRFPLDGAHSDYLLEYNTRYVSGSEPRGYSYAYGKP